MDGYTYTKSHTLTSESVLRDYQVKFVIYAGTGTDSGNTAYCNCNADFSDLRFSVDNTTALPIWVEAWEYGVYAEIWVNIPRIATSQILYLHWGKFDASNTWNGDNTFSFYDEFNSGPLNETKWTRTGTNGSINFSEDYPYCINMLLAGGGNWNAITANTDASNDNTCTTFKVMSATATGATCKARVGIKSDSTTAGAKLSLAYNDGSTLKAVPVNEGSGDGTTLTTSLTRSTWYMYDLAHDGTTFYYRIDGGEWTSWAINPSGSHIQIAVDAAIDFQSFSCDYVFQRKFVLAEPEHSTWVDGVEPPTELPATSRSMVLNIWMVLLSMFSFLQRIVKYN